jgi:MFS family permease
LLRTRPERRACKQLLRMSSMTRAALQAPPSVHAIGAAQLVAWGATFYAIPPLLPRIVGDLDASMPVLSGAMTVGLVLNALASLAVAGWIHRHGARIPMTTGSIIATAALVVLAASTSSTTAAIGLALLGAAQAALLYEPAFAAVSTQSADPVARTRAIQVITFWGGWAALWALPLASFLGGAIGWRATLLLLSALLAAHTIRVHARLPAPVFRRPQHASTKAPSISRGLAAAFALGAFATTAIVVNGLIMLGARGVSIEAASIVFALLAPLQVFGRLWFLRREGRLARHDGSLPFVLVGAGIVALLAAPRLSALALFIALFGAGAGLLTTVRASVVVLHVPPEHVARHLGAYSFVTSVARALAPAASGWLYLATGLETALMLFSAMALVAAVLVWHATACACATIPRERCSSWLTSDALACAPHSETH